MRNLKVKIRKCYPGCVEVRGQGTYPYDVGNPAGGRRLCFLGDDDKDVSGILAAKRLLGISEPEMQFLNKLYVEYQYDEELDITHAIYNHDGTYTTIVRAGKPEEANG